MFSPQSSGINGLGLRIASLVLVAAVIAYCVLVLGGAFEPEDRLGPGEFAALTIVALAAFAAWMPATIRREIKSLKVAGVELELRQEIQDIRDRQDLLFDILPLLIPAQEFAHLENLSQGRDEYGHADNLRDELRHLRGMMLIDTVPERTIAEIPSGRSFRLGDYVRLTDQGRHWVALRHEAEAHQPVGSTVPPSV